MPLHLAAGPQLLHRRSSSERWKDVTHIAHRYLFELLVLDPQVTSVDLVRLMQPNPTLLEVFERWNVRSLVTEGGLSEGREGGDASILASSGADAVTLGELLDSFASDLAFLAAARSAHQLAEGIAGQEWSDTTAEELLAELGQKTSHTKQNSDENC